MLSPGKPERFSLTVMPGAYQRCELERATEHRVFFRVLPGVPLVSVRGDYRDLTLERFRVGNIIIIPGPMQFAAFLAIARGGHVDGGIVQAMQDAEIIVRNIGDKPAAVDLELVPMTLPRSR